MASKTIVVAEDVYERRMAHERGDERISETLDRILSTLDSEWRTNAGFLTDEQAAALETEVVRGFDDADGAVSDLGDELDDRFEAIDDLAFETDRE